MKELVSIKNKQAVTTSLKVAKAFQKNHRDVLKAIRNLISKHQEIKEMFAKGTYITRQGHEKPMFYMNHFGFELLTMGFTGKAAVQIKLEYLEEFNLSTKEAFKEVNSNENM